MNAVNLYGNGPATNHGCEAISRSTARIIGDKKIRIFSKQIDGDHKYEVEKIADIVRCGNEVNENVIKHVWCKFVSVISRKNDIYYKNKYRNLLRCKNSVCLSAGGDNYCYKKAKWLIYLNKKLVKSGNKTVLWGCSVEPEILNDEEIREDMGRYSLIMARESITYKGLKENNVNSNIKLYPDPAFALLPEAVDLPDKFLEGRTVGINLSPLILKYTDQKDVIFDGIRKMIGYILKETDYNVALIPHVVQPNNDDRTILSIFYEEFKNTDRIIMIEDCNCMKLKCIISKCKMFIGARTHATIAAYSTCVPTLVIGYSVKAKGIATDLFGTYENYVLPVQDILNAEKLTESFCWLLENCGKIKEHLLNIMQEYIENALEARNEIEKITEC